MSKRNRMRTVFLSVIMMLCFLSASCAFTPRSIQTSAEGEEKCRRSSIFSSSFSQPISQSDLDTALLYYPENAVMIASAIGILSDLLQLADLENQIIEHSDSLDVQTLHLQHRLLSYVVLIMLEVNSAVAEAQCEEAKINEIVDHLQKAQTKHNQIMTLASIITSGVTGIFGGILNLTGNVLTDSIIAISGGTIASVFAGYTLLEHTDYTLDHPRNILKEVWDGPKESKIFPPSVWQFLTSPRRDQRTPRDILIDKWKSRVGINIEGTEEEKELTALLLSKGGTYGLSDLRTRASMLNMLASTIDLIEHDIEELMREILSRKNILPQE